MKSDKKWFILVVVIIVLISTSLFMALISNPSIKVEENTSAAGHLPKVLIVCSTHQPQHAEAGGIWTDLFEYGIIANVSSTSTYVSMNRSRYDIIILVGYSNPVSPQQIHLNVMVDLKAGRKVIFMSYYPLKQTCPNGTTLEICPKFTAVGMPWNWPTAEVSGIVNLTCNPGDAYLKEDVNASHYSLHSPAWASMFGILPDNATGWIKDETSGYYYAIFINEAGWICESGADGTAVHMGKVVAKLWWNGSQPYGFSMNSMYGSQVFLWRVDGDVGNQGEYLNWISNLATMHNFKCNIGARGDAITSNQIASYWRELGDNPLVKIGVHTYDHKVPISAQNITHEVIDTYNLLRSYDIPTEKFLLGWGPSDWSWQQIKTLFDQGWRIIHSSREDPRSYVINGSERFGVVHELNVLTIANFTVAPAIFGVSGRADWNAFKHNFNFTEANIESYEKCKLTQLPYIFLTHDYSNNETQYFNSFGSMKSQIQQFFDWVELQNAYPVWITEYYDFFYDAVKGRITRNGENYTVTRPDGKANFVKIFVGSKSTHAEGASILTQRIQDGWLYLTLKPENVSTFMLSNNSNPNTISD